MDFGFNFIIGVVENALFEFFGDGFDFVDNGVIVIDRYIEQRVGEVIGGALSDFSAPRCQSVRYRCKTAVGIFLKRNDQIIADVNRYLFDFHFAFFLVKAQHFDDKEKAVFVFLKFRALVYVQNVFQNQRVNFEFPSDFFQ